MRLVALLREFCRRVPGRFREDGERFVIVDDLLRERRVDFAYDTELLFYEIYRK